MEEKARNKVVILQKSNFEAIRLHFEEGVPHRSIMNQLGINSDVIDAWLREYSEGRRDFTTDKSKSRLTYTPDIKLEEARLHVEMGLTYKEHYE